MTKSFLLNQSSITKQKIGSPILHRRQRMIILTSMVMQMMICPQLSNVISRRKLASLSKAAPKNMNVNAVLGCNHRFGNQSV